MAESAEIALATEAPLAPLTGARKIRDDLEDFVPKPYLARALAAPDTDHPNGTEGRDPHGKSVLQQHASFFDRDGDGKIYPWETYVGVRAIGFNWAVCLFAAITFNFSFSYFTSPSWIPNLLFPIHVPTIHKGKHGSDSGTYDNEGRFIPAKLENVFSKYGLTKTDKLSLKEVWSMTQGVGVAGDFFGWLVTKVEWIMLYYLARDDEGFLSKDAARGLFDGSLFEYCAKKTMEKHEGSNADKES